MIKNKASYIFIIFLTFFYTITINACTIFTIHYHHDYIVGQNFDWGNRHGYMLIHPAGIKRSSPLIKQKGHAVAWTSKYPSITFDVTEPHSRQLKASIGGINSNGLSAVYYRTIDNPKIRYIKLGSIKGTKTLIAPINNDYSGQLGKYFKAI